MRENLKTQDSTYIGTICSLFRFYSEVNVKYMLTRTEINMIVERFADITGQQNDVVMNTKQCAKCLGISPGALRKRVYDGTLPYSKKGRLLYFSRLEINQYLLGGQTTNIAL